MKKNRIIVCVGLAFFLFGCANDISNKESDHLIRVAQKARETGNSEAAINFYKKAKEINENDPQIYLGIAEVYIDMKLLDAATEYLKMAEERSAPISKLCYLRGKIYLLSNQLDLAKKEFLKSDCPDCLNALGAMYDNSGDHEKAQRLYKRVISKDPNYIDAYNNLGLSMLLCKKYKEAIFYLENACSFPNANASYRGNLALGYGLCGDVKKAKEIYAKDFEGDELDEKVAYIEDIIAKPIKKRN